MRGLRPAWGTWLASRALMELRDMSNAKRTMAVFGRRAVVVALSTLTIFSSVPTAALAEMQEEVATTIEQGVESQDTSADSASDEVTQAERAATEQTGQDYTAGQETSSKSSDSSEQADVKEHPSAPAATEADVALSGLEHATVKRVDGQELTTGATKVTVSTSEDFKFTVEPNNGYSLKAVKLTVSGAERELTADADGYFTISAADILSGSSLKLETEADADGSDVNISTKSIDADDASGKSSDSKDAESLINSIAETGDEHSISGPAEVTMGESITLTFTGEGAAQGWQDNSGAFDLSVSEDGQSVTATAKTGWVFNGKSKDCNIVCWYTDASGTWHTGDEQLVKTVTVNKRAFTVVAPEAVSAYGSHYVFPTIVDAATGETVDWQGESGDAFTINYYKDGEFVANQSQMKSDGAKYLSAFSSEGVWTIEVTPNDGYFYTGVPQTVVIPEDYSKPEDTETDKYIYVGDSLDIEGTAGAYHEWSYDAGDFLTVEIESADDVQTNKATLTGLKVGTVTLTHKASDFSWFWPATTDTITVHVIKKPTVSTLSVEGADTVEQFSSTDLAAKLEPEVEGGTYTWSSSNENVLTVDENGKATGVTQGSATVTVTWTSDDGKTVLTATHDMTVTHTTNGTTTFTYYYLNNPAASLDSLKGNWYCLGDGKVDLTGVTSAEFPRDNGNTKRYDAIDRVVSWPDGSTGTTFSVARDSEHWANIVKQYKDVIQQKLPGVTVTDDDITSITLVPYKLTNNGDGYHVDCSVLIECKGVYTVTYYLDDPSSSGSTGFAPIASSATVREGDSTNITDFIADFATKYPQTKTVDGVEYTLSPWCTDSAMTHSVTLPYTVSTSNVTFYARYAAGRQVIYNLDGGSWSASAATTYKVNEGQTYTVLSEPTRDGYDFAGWQVEGLEDEDTVASGDSFTMPDNNVYITAKWTKKAASVTVNYLWGTEDSSELIDSVTASGEHYVGDVFAIDQKSFDGYTIKPLKSGNVVLKAGDNVVNVYYYKNVTLTANSSSAEYDGTEKSVTGFSINAEGVTIDGVTTTGGKGTDAGVYEHKFADGTVGKADTTNKYVVASVLSGKLTITRSTKAVTIKVAGNTGGDKYSGKQQSVTGFKATELPAGITESDISLSGKAEATGTDAGTYQMNLSASQFSYTGKNYDPAKVAFELVSDGSLTIAKRKVTLWSEDGHKNYDGAALTRRTDVRVDGTKEVYNNQTDTSTEKTFEGDGFVDGEGVEGKTKTTWYNQNGESDETNIAPGVYENKFTVTFKSATNLDNYDITYDYGKLYVNKRADKDKYKVTINANSAEVFYDGTEQAASGVYASVPSDKQGSASGMTFTDAKSKVTFTISGYSASVTKTDAGTYDNNVVTGEVKVIDAAGNDVTDEFVLSTNKGTLKIKPRLVTLASESDEKEYDGKALANSTVTATKYNAVTGEGFVDGEGATYKVTGSQTEPGSSENKFSYTLSSNTKKSNYTITQKFGTLNVKTRSAKYEIAVEANSAEDTYDGTEKSVSGLKTTTFTVDGNTYTVEGLEASGAKSTDAGEFANTVTGTAVVKDAKGNDVTSEFAVSVKNGTLKVNKRAVTIMSKSAGKVYDGQPLTKNEVKVTSGSIADADKDNVEYAFTGSQTNVGSSENLFSVVAGLESKNYDITLKAGTLEVTPVVDEVVVTITERGGSLTYDGDEHTVTGYDVSSSNVLYTADDFAFAGNSSVSGTNAGTYEMKLKAADFSNVSANFSNVKFVIVDNVLTINKREVELTSGSATKVYDGKALANESVTVTKGSFVKDEGFTANVSGTITNAGSVENGFTYELTGGATEGEGGNYTITKKAGTLTVSPVNTAVTVTIKGNVVSSTYDGSEKSASGYEVSIDNGLYTEDDFEFSGNAEVKATDAGSYAMGLAKSQFSNKSKNFTNVVFTVVDGGLAIAKREVTLKSANLTKEYDGTALTNGGTELETEEGWVDGEGATYEFTGSQTVVGSSANAFTYVMNSNTKESNYAISATAGNLSVTTRDAKYEITIVANSTTVTYDGSEHEAAGIETSEFTVNGKRYTVSGLTTSSPKKTDAGTYENTISGTAIVKDENGNDVTSEFAVSAESGSLVINKAAVTLKSASGEWVYDGAAHDRQEMETVSGFAAGEGATFAFGASVANVSEGEVDNTFTYTLNANTKEGNYTFRTETGSLKVTPVTEKVVVTITESSDSKQFNGYEQQVEGYTFSSDNELYGESCVSFVGDASHKIAKGTYVGTYDMGIVDTDFVNVSENFSNVEFKIVDGQLEITPASIDADQVVWTKSDVVKTYDGKTVSAGVATATDKFGNSLAVEYSVDGKTWTSDPSEIEALNTSDSKVVKLRATSSNYSEGSYSEDSELLTVNPRALTFTSASDSKVYDGTPLTRNEQSDVTIGGDGFVRGEGATFAITGSQTEAGSSSNDFTYSFDDATLSENYVVTSQTAGTLVVTADDGEVVVTIKGNSNTVTYDGKLHEVKGYEVVKVTGGNGKFTASDVAVNEGVELVVSGDDVAVNADGSVASYERELVSSDFKSTNANFSNVTFVIDQSAPSVSLTINKRDVTLSSESETWTYDGKAHSKPEVTSTDELFASQVSGLKAVGQVTEVSEGQVANVITYTAGESFKETNYNAAKDEGVLQVIPAGIDQDNVTWSTIDIVKTYDGNTYSAGIATATDAYGNALEVEYSADGGKTWTSGPSAITATNVSESKTVQLRAKNGNYYDYATSSEALTVTPAKLAVTTPDATKEYDGDALTAAGELTGLVNNETLKFETTGSQTLVGKSENDYQVDWESSETTASKGNYTLVATLGTLVVSAPADNGKVVTKSHVAGTYGLGDEVTFTVKATNVYNTAKTMTLEEIEGVTLSQSTFENVQPGATVSAIATYAITEADILSGTFVNTITVKFSGEDKSYVNTDEVDVDKANAHLAVTKTTTSEPENKAAYKLGEAITYRITVANDGNLTITDITVADPNADDFDEQVINSLAPGESKSFEATHVVTEADIKAGFVTNVATAKGADPTGKETEGKGEDTETIDELSALLGVVKTASEPVDGESYKLNEVVTYTITVTNNGNVAYNNVKVVDEKTGLNETIAALAVGETKEFTTEHTIDESDIAAGTYANTATATADPIVDPSTREPVTPSGKDTEVVGGEDGRSPIEKGNADLVVNKTVANEGTGEDGAFKLGEVIEYEISVTNNGNLTAKNFQLIDPNADDFAPVTIESLAPGATMVAIKASHVVTSDDILAGKVTNVATTSGGSTIDPGVNPTPTPGEVDSDTDKLDTTLEVTKVADAPADGKAYKLNEVVNYTITVTNKGNVPYYNVVVSDAKTGLDETIDVLAVGEAKTFTTVHTISEADIVAGTYINEATAKADPVVDPESGKEVTPSGEASETIGGDKGGVPIDAADPKLVVTKTSDVAEGHLLKEGETVNYAVSVTNVGNLTLTNVVVDDQLAGVTLADGESATIETLAPGASATLHYSYVVKQSDVVAGSVKNHATAAANNPSKKDTVVVPGDKEDPTEKAEPSLSVIKTADKSFGVTAGDVITYTITATNNGNVDLTDVAVTDELTGYTSETFNLAKGESKQLITTYEVTEADMVAGSVTNVANAAAKDPSGNDVPASGETSSRTEEISSSLKVVKTAANGTYAAGDTVEYTITVTNTGNVSVSDIKVVDEKTGLDETVSLARGEEKDFTTTYKVTEEDIKAGKLENVASAKGTDPAGKEVEDTDTNVIDDSRQADPDNPDKPTLKREMNVSEIPDTVYNGLSQELKPEVTDKYGNVLVEGTDYTITYSRDTTNTGEVTATITGKGNYSGTFTRTYKITPATLTVITPSDTKVYDGEALKADGSYSGLVNGETIGFVTTGSQTEAGNSANTYEIEWANDGILGFIGGNAYTAKRSNYVVSETVGTLTVTVQSIDPGVDPENPDPSYKGVTIDDPSDVVYDATEHKWTPVVTDKNGKLLVEGTDYVVTYGTDDFTNVGGSIIVTITGIGSYSGTVTRSYQITPAELIVTTGSATKAYDGSALVSAELSIEGLKGADYVTAATTGSQTEVGSSTNTYSLAWSGALESNYRIVKEDLGTLTVTEAPAPAPTPAPEPADGGNTPSNGNGSAIDAVADALAGAAAAVTGEELETEQIFDASNPLGKAQHIDCWVHFYLIVGIIVTLLYGASVDVRRRRFSGKLAEQLKDVLSGSSDGSVA